MMPVLKNNPIFVFYERMVLCKKWGCFWHRCRATLQNGVTLRTKNIHMKKIFVSCFVLLFYYIGLAQDPLLVQSNSKGLYFSHTVHPKENFYSVGRLYNLPPKEIAAFNALDMNAGLSVGQTVLIPLTAANFSQTKNTGTPVY